MTSTPQEPRGRREPGALVQSVDRAITVLEILAKRGVAGVTEIALELGVHKSTASRLVGVLEGRGLVEQLTDRGKYRLGFGIVRLAGALTVQRDLAHESRKACEALAGDVGETVNVAILDGNRVVNVSQVRGPAAIAMDNWVGQSTPSHATSSGKVLLAFAGPADLHDHLAEPLQRYTERTITDVRTLEQEFERVRAQGWAATVEEYEVGLNAVAAPVRNHEDAVVAAVSVSGPSYRLTSDSLPRVATRVLAAAREFSRRLGHIA
jgi:DNA-binding IclR family transcriptional regulator